VDDKKDNTKIREILTQLVKFHIVGAVNTAITYAIYSLLVFSGMQNFAALCVEYPIGIAISFYLNGKYTFGMKKRRFEMLFRMIISYIPSFVLNFFFLWFFTEKAGLNSYISQIIAVVLVMIISFILQKTFVFKERMLK
jgi:putative flippase GtrA